MNTHEFFRRINRGIEECKEGMHSDPDERQRILSQGIMLGLQAATTIFNEVNHGACEEGELLRNCHGFSDRKDICKNKVPAKFLRLWCDDCFALRAQQRGIVAEIISDENIYIIPFKGLQ